MKKTNFAASLISLLGVIVLLYIAYIVLEPVITASIEQLNAVLPGLIK